MRSYQPPDVKASSVEDLLEGCYWDPFVSDSAARWVPPEQYDRTQPPPPRRPAERQVLRALLQATLERVAEQTTVYVPQVAYRTHPTDSERVRVQLRATSPVLIPREGESQ